MPAITPGNHLYWIRTRKGRFLEHVEFPDGALAPFIKAAQGRRLMIHRQWHHKGAVWIEVAPGAWRRLGTIRFHYNPTGYASPGWWEAEDVRPSGPVLRATPARIREQAPQLPCYRGSWVVARFKALQA